MANAYKCDRCGKLFERDRRPSLTIQQQYSYCFGNTTYDLCPSCQEKLEKFIEGGD